MLIVIVYLEEILKKMKVKNECTLIGFEKFAGYGSQAGKTFVTLSFIDHYTENNEPKMRCLVCTVNEEKLNAAMEYRGLKTLDINKRYEVWRQQSYC